MGTCKTCEDALVTKVRDLAEKNTWDLMISKYFFYHYDNPEVTSEDYQTMYTFRFTVPEASFGSSQDHFGRLLPGSGLTAIRTLCNKNGWNLIDDEVYSMSGLYKLEGCSMCTMKFALPKVNGKTSFKPMLSMQDAMQSDYYTKVYSHLSEREKKARRYKAMGIPTSLLDAH